MKNFVFFILVITTCNCLNSNCQSVTIKIEKRNSNLISGNIATIYLPRRIKIERAVASIDTTIKKDMGLLIQKMRDQQVITNNVQTSVDAKVEEETDSVSGEKLLNFHVEYKYEVVKAFLERQTDDFPLGKYKLLSSNAAKITMQLLKQAVENQLAEYLSNNTKVTIKITGSTDGTPIVGTIPYLDEFGEINNQEYFLNGSLDEITINKKSGIKSNAQIAFLRTYGVRDFIEKFVEQFRVTQNTFQHYAVIAKDRGAQYRRISIEIIIHDAFRNKFLDDTSIAQNRIKAETYSNDQISDVDKNIPINITTNDKTFAVIIGNEKYNNEISVKYAENDANIFKEYLSKTIGIPEDHLHLKLNATYGEMLGEIDWLNSVSKIFGKETKIIFYYAGHGMPNEGYNGSYLLPIDGRSTQPKTAILIDDIYATLTQFETKQATVFLDACFSGGAREGTLVSGRGVKIKPKENTISGNLIVFTAASGNQTAHPITEKRHGLFTYYLLKKLQESGGNITYKELGEYILKNVNQTSIIRGTEQTPKILNSIEVTSNWENWTLR